MNLVPLSFEGQPEGGKLGRMSIDKKPSGSLPPMASTDTSSHTRCHSADLPPGGAPRRRLTRRCREQLREALARGHSRLRRDGYEAAVRSVRQSYARRVEFGADLMRIDIEDEIAAIRQRTASVGRCYGAPMSAGAAAC